MRIPTLADHRHDESWTWEMLDNNDNLIGQFDGVSVGSIKKNVAATIRTGGSLTWSGQVVPPWSRIRLRPVYRATLIDGEKIEWPFGVFILGAPVTNWSGSKATAEVELFDKLLVVEEDQIDATFSLPAGTVVTTAIKSILEGAGESKYTIMDSTATLPNPLSWEVGTKKLRIINDLLVAINYFSLWCDDRGYYRGDPYVLTTQRGEAWKFEDGEASIYAPEFQHDTNFFGIPNKVILVSQGNEDTEALVAVATNTNPADPLSFQNRGDGTMEGGRWISVTETGAEADSQATLDDLAERRLESLSQRYSTIEIDHAIVPIDLNNLVAFKRGPAALDLKGVVQEMDIPCVSGGLVRTTIREVRF